MNIVDVKPWEHFDHIVMNLPASALEFLGTFHLNKFSVLCLVMHYRQSGQDIRAMARTPYNILRTFSAFYDVSESSYEFQVQTGVVRCFILIKGWSIIPTLGELKRGYKLLS